MNKPIVYMLSILARFRDHLEQIFLLTIRTTAVELVVSCIENALMPVNVSLPSYSAISSAR